MSDGAVHGVVYLCFRRHSVIVPVPSLRGLWGKVPAAENSKTAAAASSNMAVPLVTSARLLPRRFLGRDSALYTAMNCLVCQDGCDRWTETEVNWNPIGRLSLHKRSGKGVQQCVAARPGLRGPT
ncbi:hypothetical protein O3P69_000727 [Scylla paramamosain]|uniref:Uncharacterized protein n=1 Tax=Scylla paramamosain TaxID=85552 RepID=A0AAW0URF5_SCYPA